MVSNKSLKSSQAVIVYLTDDFTGATDSAALLSQINLSDVHFLNYDRLSTPLLQGQAYIVNIASRDADEVMARERLKNSIRRLKQELADRHILWGKRIDSTLRGHITSELAFLRSELSGPLLVAPAFPQAGRSTLEGHQLTGGRSVAELEGVPQGHLPTLFKELGFTTFLLDLSILRAGIKPPFLRQLRCDEVLIADAANDSDLKTLAEWTLESWQSGAVVIDSGPYLAHLVSIGLQRGLWQEREEAASPIIVVLGSRSALTATQVDHLERSGTRLLRLALPFDPAFLPKTKAAEVVVLEADTQKSNIDDALGDLSVAARQVLDSLPAPYTLVISGGRTAGSVLATLSYEALDIPGEVFPLIPLGRFKGGQLDGSLLVTKGGFVGQTDTLTQIIKTLKLIRRLT